jgi:hypothetical protein
LYRALESTGPEQKRVLEAFGQGPGDGLRGSAASTAAVRRRLPQARYAHFATHGYFDEASLGAERQRLQDYLDKWTLQADNPPAGAGPRNPAGYVGLVLAGANDPQSSPPALRPALTWLRTSSAGAGLGRLEASTDLACFVFRRIANTLLRNLFIVVSLAADQPLGLWRSVRADVARWCEGGPANSEVVARGRTGVAW